MRARGLGKKDLAGRWKGFWSLAGRALVMIGLFWLASVLVFRFINPPITPLMVIRSGEYLITEKPLIRQWDWVPLSEIPLPVQQAVVAAEDARFMDHWGVDFSAVEDAMDDSGARKRPRGASTITMQTVKNVFLWPGRSYFRKIIEVGMAPIAGVVWGKRRTLELYLNIIEWGEGVYGIEAASQFYFKRSVRQLSLQQAAALASVLPSPRRLSPNDLSEVSRQRYERIVKEANAVPLPTSFYTRVSAKRRARL